MDSKTIFNIIAGVIAVVCAISFLLVLLITYLSRWDQCEELGFDAFDAQGNANNNVCIKYLDFNTETGFYAKCYMPFNENIHAEEWCK